jgi:hypothetical protein
VGKRHRVLPEIAILPLIIGSTLLPTRPSWGQGFDFSNLTISNQLEYSLEEGSEDEILEEWFDLRYQTEPFSFGARYEAFQPSEQSAGKNRTLAPHVTEQGFPFRFLEFQRNDIKITAGNFYDIFGRGIAFRSYENRDIRIDSNLEGIRVGMTRDIFDATFLSGSTFSSENLTLDRERSGLLHAANVEARLSDRFRVGALQHLLLGGSAVRTTVPDILDPSGSQRSEIATGRVEFGLDRIYFYGEYGNRFNNPGHAVYLGTNLDLLGVGLSLEYKEYEEFALVNNPPALTREHTYTLLSRNSYNMNPNDEKGFQVEATWTPVPMNTFLLNFSQTKSFHESDLLFEEFYAEWSRYQGDHLYWVLAFASQINQEIRSVIPLLELEIFLDDRNSFRTELQHQHQKAVFLGEFDVNLLVAEYSRSPTWTLSLIAERDNMSDLQRDLQGLPEKQTFVSGQASVHLSESHDLIVFLGSRQKGKVCVGGVCRTEPEFDGLEVKLFSRF